VKHRAQRGRRAVARSCAAGSGLALAAMLATLATLGCRRDPNYCPEAPLNKGPRMNNRLNHAAAVRGRMM
jgi:hypothetical protein